MDTLASRPVAAIVTAVIACINVFAAFGVFVPTASQLGAIDTALTLALGLFLPSVVPPKAAP